MWSEEDEIRRGDINIVGLISIVKVQGFTRDRCSKSFNKIINSPLISTIESICLHGAAAASYTTWIIIIRSQSNKKTKANIPII